MEEKEKPLGIVDGAREYWTACGNLANEPYQSSVCLTRCSGATKHSWRRVWIRNEDIDRRLERIEGVFLLKLGARALETFMGKPVLTPSGPYDSSKICTEPNSYGRGAENLRRQLAAQGIKTQNDLMQKMSFDTETREFDPFRLVGYPIDSKSPTKLTPKTFVDAVNKAYESFDIRRRYDEVHIDEAGSFGPGILDQLHLAQRKIMEEDAKYMGRTYDHVLIDGHCDMEILNEGFDTFDKLVERVGEEVWACEGDEWQIHVPDSVSEKLTPDSAPRLEAALREALALLKKAVQE